MFLTIDHSAAHPRFDALAPALRVRMLELLLSVPNTNFYMKTLEKLFGKVRKTLPASARKTAPVWTAPAER